MNPISRAQAIKALYEIQHKAFGQEKGSGEAYQVWAEDMHLCDEWDGEGDPTEDMTPPDWIELLVAVGVRPEELVEHCHINPAIFTDEFRRMYP